MDKLNECLNEEVLVHSKTNGKDLCVAGILREIRDDIISLAYQVKMMQDGTFKMVDSMTIIPSNDIITISNGQKVIKLR